MVRMPMMTTTTMISTSVKPPLDLRRAIRSGTGARTGVELGIQVPVANVRIFALATFLTVGAEGVEVIVATMGTGIDILVVVAPGVLEGSFLDIAALAPVADGGVI